MPDANGYLLPDERRILLRRFAPVLILFPERREQAPYPDNGDAIYTMRSSYHPRAAEFFLKYAKVRYRRRLWLRNPRLIFKPRPYTVEIDRIKQAITGSKLQQAAAAYGRDPRYAGLGDAELQGAAFTRLVQQRLAARVRGFDLPHYRGYNLQHWEDYFNFLSQTDPATRRSAVYGRLVQGLAPIGADQASLETTQASNYPYDVSQSRVALQYWFPYYYDDWANRHEGDWESITLLLDIQPDLITQARELSEDELLAGAAVQDVGYSSHEDGYRRLWADVQKTREGRPIVYIARGSSASYFGWQLSGYPTSARIGFVEKILEGLGSLVRGKRLFGRRWDVEIRARFTGRDPKNTDWVAADPQPQDRLGQQGTNPLEAFVPLSGRGVRRSPTFAPDAGQDDKTYYLETDDLFWLEIVEEYGVQWGESYFLPGAGGPSGESQKTRREHRALITALAQVEVAAEQALDHVIGASLTPSSAMPELVQALKPLRPGSLRKQGCFPANVREYVYDMWASILRAHPEAWPGGPGLWLRWRFAQVPKMGPLLKREDPIYHLKSLLALVRRTRYEVQHDGSKWDNPFAWVRHVCQADTFYYGISQAADTLDINYLDCVDKEMTAV